MVKRNQESSFIFLIGRKELPFYYSKMKLTTRSLRDAPHLFDAVDALGPLIWPTFMMQDPIGNRYWHALFEHFPEYQLAILDDSNDEVVGLINSIPLSWDRDLAELPASGWDWAFETGVEQFRQGLQPTIQCALQVALLPAIQGKGASAQMLLAMKAVGQRAGLRALVAPVRPSGKHLYPLTPMEEYVSWRREDGLLFDPWMRVHERLGARISHVCSRSMEITATIAEWESWTGLKLPASGEYIIPKALVKISVDRRMNTATYIEPNVWMIHPM